jgi:hypothetical protein
VTGHVSLLVMGDNKNGLAPEYAAAIRRLVARYGAHGLQVTVVHKTQGYWVRDGTETGPKRPEQEAKLDSAYYLDYLKLPVTVAVVESPMQTLGNGWVMSKYPQLPYEDQNIGWTAVLADTAGRLVRKFAGVPGKQINAYLDRLLGLADGDMTPSATSSTATGQKH